MDGFAQALCFFCAMTASAPQPQSPQGTLDIWVTHEMLGRNTHLLRLSTTDRILDGNAARDRRLHAYAGNFASQTCQGGFDLAPAERASWPLAGPLYARQYAFRCR
ncbi:MAG: hypothetical protein J0H42_16355 [Rhizobiales bacterium]|nr:hypothetical protein [Hyphomicrobiales bacterium]